MQQNSLLHYTELKSSVSGQVEEIQYWSNLTLEQWDLNSESPPPMFDILFTSHVYKNCWYYMNQTRLNNENSGILWEVKTEIFPCVLEYAVRIVSSYVSKINL
jgi:hypothetical protein